MSKATFQAGLAAGIVSGMRFPMVVERKNPIYAVWTEAVPFIASAVSHFYVDGKWVVFTTQEDDSGSTHSYIYTSANGVNWDLTAVTPVSITSNVKYANGRYIGYSGKTVYYSTNLVDWTAVEIPFARSSSISHIPYGRGRFLAVGSSVGDAFWYSDDCVNWTAVDSPGASGFRCNSVSYVNDAWFARPNSSNSTNNSVLYRSTDAINWKIVNSVKGNVYVPMYADGLYIFLVNKWTTDPRSTDYYYSKDGVSWTAGTAIGLADYPIGLVNVGGMWFADVEYQGTMRCSKDCKSWVSTNLPDNGYLTSIVYADGIFVGNFTADMGSPTRRQSLMYSTDGVNWEESVVTESYSELAYTDGVFIGYGPKGCLYSSDGKTWSQSNITELFEFFGSENGVCVGATGKESGWLTNYTALVYSK